MILWSTGDSPQVPQSCYCTLCGSPWWWRRWWWPCWSCQSWQSRCCTGQRRGCTCALQCWFHRWWEWLKVHKLKLIKEEHNFPTFTTWVSDCKGVCLTLAYAVTRPSTYRTWSNCVRGSRSHRVVQNKGLKVKPSVIFRWAETALVFTLGGTLPKNTCI